MNRVPLALAAPLLLVGCGQDGAADNEAAALERAADQGSPEAADILRNADPGANVQEEVMQSAGNAQAATGAPQHQGAKPHSAGDPVPPPKVPAGGNGQ